MSPLDDNYAEPGGVEPADPLAQVELRGTRADHPDTAVIKDSARPLEIGVVEAEGVEFIVHAMAARPKFLETRCPVLGLRWS